MSCPFGDELLEKWDGVANPMGPACFACYECECEHWMGCADDCDMEDRTRFDCKKLYPPIESFP